MVTDADRPEPNAGAERAGPPIPLILSLGRVLEDSGVDYCHWKSNAAIDRSLSGDNDLDLLVGRGDVRRFTELLCNLGFARAYKPGTAVPGVESFYGFDQERDRWVHVHAHYQLVLGDDRTKNYRLPIEEAYIRSAAPSDVLRLPAPEFEFIVFVIRMTLKYCTWDETLWCALRGRRAGPGASERHEFGYLRPRVDAARLSSILAEHFPFVVDSLFSACVAALTAEIPFRERVRAGRSLEVALQPHARRSRGADTALRVARRISIAAARRTRRAPRNRLIVGGAMVGVMGGDGAGKSTVLAELERWLGAEFDVRVVHLGKPRWSGTTTTVRGALKVAAVTTDALRRRVEFAPMERLGIMVSDYRPLLWLLCTARDRHRTYGRARRFAMRGGLVLCDRYPHPRLTSMEVPLIATRAGGRVDGRLVKTMVRLEERYHRSIAQPELLVVLRVDPEIAVARKVEESPDNVRRRGAEIWSIDWRAAGAHVVDASQPREAVARELKTLVWSAIA